MIVQTVLIRWMKDTRGEPYASARNRHPASFMLPAAIPSVSHQAGEEPMLVHQLAFQQTATGFERLSETYKWLPMPSANMEIVHERVPGLFPQKRTEDVVVRFAYDPSFGKPARSDYRSRLLNEQVFVLRDGEYGRIIINGRHTLEEGSLYEFRTINVWNMKDASMLNKNQSGREPNYIRKYLASLW